MTPEANALWQRGEAAIKARRLGEARESFEQLLKLQPTSVPARMLLASVHLAEGDLRAGTRETLAAAEHLPPDVGTICRVAQALRQLGETNAARAALAHSWIKRSRDAPALLALGHVHQGLGEHEQALALMDRALALGMNNPDLRFCRAVQLQFHGRLEEAQAELELCLRMGPTHGRASLMLARLRKATPERNQLEFIGQRLRQVRPGTEDEAAFEFARYEELEALGRDDEAWNALARGNALMHARLNNSKSPADGRRFQLEGPELSALVDAIVARATPEFLADVADPGPPPSPEHPQPIFVLGMPRSGTTLLERILGRHPQVTAAGELIEFPRQWRQAAGVHAHAIVDTHLLSIPTDFAEVGRRYLEQTRWRARGRAYYVDKLPRNFWMAGFIHKALPQARILHMRRAPIELCFSNWRAMFGDSFSYSYDMDALATHHAAYRRLMAHWHAAMPGVMHDVDYAALVADTEREARSLLAYCGLDWRQDLLDAGKNARPVATLSSAQVRAPIRTDTGRDWQRYAAQLEPLRRALDE